MSSKQYLRKPEWLKVKLPTKVEFSNTKKVLTSLNLNTVCQSARCPNIFECFSKKTATFLILGKFCTRNCAFCKIEHFAPEPVDRDEPFRILEAVKRLDLKYVVITSVTRDDLEDGGASQFQKVISLLKQHLSLKVEVLTPDFRGDFRSLEKVISSGPYVFNHNLETISRLYPKIRPQANYKQSLDVLEQAKKMDKSILTKSGLMLGLGENKDEVKQTLEDLKKAGCDWITLGQYLQPTRYHFPVQRYVHPDEFEELKEFGQTLGLQVFAGPLVRSSYHAAELLETN
ncbi:MAG: lipoyl synthase [Desulfonauticus sp.]|nr:lipoyl synthase [Desulfonauticus sp.]